MQVHMSNRPKNIILCQCDQLRAFALGCYGNEWIHTPNIDALAERGVRFGQAVSNNPVCVPARSILLSGQYGRTCTGSLRNDAHDPPCKDRVRLTDATLPELLRQQGYETALIGKWHVHPAPQTVGFDHCVYPLIPHRYTDQTYFLNSDEPTVIHDYAPEFEIDQVEQYVRQRTDTPFFLYYNISPPHMPVLEMPERYRTMYDPAEIPLRPNVYDTPDEQLPWDERWFKIYLWDFLFYRQHQPYTEQLPEGFDLRSLTALYAGMVTWVDDLVGRLMSLLKETGLDEDTLVVFLSDHGDNLGSHGLFNKDCLMEESIRIPLIYHWPERLAPAVHCDCVPSLLDQAPTILDLAGLTTPDHMQGRSLAPVATGQASGSSHPLAFIETPKHHIGIRTCTHMYGLQLDEDNQTILDEPRWFYDLQADPLQENNLAETQGSSPLGLELHEQLVQWHEKTDWLKNGCP